MTPRSIRRAQERKAAKQQARQARNSAQVNQTATPLAVPPAPTLAPAEALHPNGKLPLTEARLAANQANAQLSTGPTTPEGKSKSALNAVKTGLTGRTILLPTDDAAAYTQLVAAYHDELQPVGQRESDLTQSIADTAWRLQRIPALESAIFAHGYLELADQFEDEDPANRPARIQLETFFKYEKQLRNLQLHEARLARRREKETAELRQLQQERRAQQQQLLEQQLLDRQTLPQTANTCPQTPTPSPAPQTHPDIAIPLGGFEFSTAAIAHAAGKILNGY